MEDQTAQPVFPAEAKATPNSFNRVTSLSKLLALALLIILPVAAFFFGKWYEQQATPDTSFTTTSSTHE